MGWHETALRVRFHEIDEYGIAWHGHHLAWFEVGRTDLVRRFDLTPTVLRREGLLVPIVRLEVDYREPARADEELLILTSLEPPRTAALTFLSEVRRQSDRHLLARGRTSQVPIRESGELLYRLPPTIAARVEAMAAYLAEPAQSNPR